MAMLLALKSSAAPLNRRVYQALKSGIREGRFGPGSRLPSTRALAADLGVSRNTVTLAYEQLAAEGYVASKDRSSTTVLGIEQPRTLVQPVAGYASQPVQLSAYARRLMQDKIAPPAAAFGRRPGVRYDFRYGSAALDEFPNEIWRRLLSVHARQASRDTLGYGFPAGHLPLRVALADYLQRARGLHCDADQIIIVNGAQQAIDLAARVLLDPGDAVVVEEPHYPGATKTFAAMGARLLRLATDAQGLDTAQLPPAGAGARLAYVTPCHQFPSGTILPLERRLALLDWAARTGAWVLEDDYVSEFRYEGKPLEPLQALDRLGRVIHVGTFSKTLFPSLRLGYLVLPRSLVQHFIAAKWVTDRFSMLLPQMALADFISSGQFEKYLRRAGARNAARREALVEALSQHFGDRADIAGGKTGVHLLVWFKDVPPADMDAFIARAAQAGVGLYSIAPYFAEPLTRCGLLFGYASLSVSEIRTGIRKLAELVPAPRRGGGKALGRLGKMAAAHATP
ncbi:PLP-dependent aminotransferase family protein [Polaromonas sp.]|uniref:MocR-like pyridoxine biosynthesis transcription factor PdxR n=1 Tax=Polaromonas sp. TaxID=1869339 RepID=UPI0024897CF2|nr:PLP-dependent aminotransferase family protein [Polaromonas sp.]MDI1338469.1 PLP-dependent aminotransferase family protein [Polaromonas sp.]